MEYFAAYPVEDGVRRYEATSYIKACMKVRDMSYNQMGKAISTSPQNVWNILNSRGRKTAGPRLGTVRQMLEALDAQIELEPCEAKPELFTGSKELDEIPFDALTVLLEAVGQRLVIKAKKEEKKDE